MYRLIMLAALMLSVIGSLTLMSGTSPLAAQANPGATRSIDLGTVAPGGTVTVTITLTGEGALSTITETLPTGFAYVSGSSSLNPADVVAEGETINFVPLGEASEFTYQVTASSVAGSHTFNGRFNVTTTEGYAVTGDSVVTVSGDAAATPVVTPVAGIDPVGNDLQFDVVPAKAVKGAVVSGLTRPIGSNPLEWPGS